MRQNVTVLAVEVSAGGAFSSGWLLTEGFSELEVLFQATGAAAPTVSKVETVSDAATLLKTDTVAIGIGGDGRIVYGKSTIAPSAANAISCGPVPKFTRFYVTGGAASGCRMVVSGIREETQIRG